MDALARWRLLRLHVEDGIPLAALARDTDISLRTLQRWKQAYTADGIAGLNPRERADAGGRRTDANVVAFVERLALTRPRPSIATLYRLTVKEADRLGRPSPGYSTVRSIVQGLDPGLVTLALEGPVAYRDRYETNRLPAILLIPGHWLGAWAWDEVVEHLDPARERTVAMTLPGLDPADPARATRTLDDQVDAILAALAEADAAARPAVIVAHSGANAPVSVVLDRHPELIRRVVWVDSGPAASGAAFAPDLPDAVEDMPLPSFDALAQQASLEGLSADGLERFRTRAVPEPGLVLRQPIALSNPRRHAVPTTLVCCSLPSAQVREWAGAGHPMFAEVALLEDVTLVDLPTGHWPMWSRPADLAETIRVAAQVE